MTCSPLRIMASPLPIMANHVSLSKFTNIPIYLFSIGIQMDLGFRGVYIYMYIYMYICRYMSITRGHWVTSIQYSQEEITQIKNVEVGTCTGATRP